MNKMVRVQVAPLPLHRAWLVENLDPTLLLYHHVYFLVWRLG